MKQYDISEILQNRLTNNYLDLRDEELIVKLFQFCVENNIEPVYTKLEHNEEVYASLKMIEKTVACVRNGISPSHYWANNVLETVLEQAK